MIKDWRGNEIGVGSRIVWPGRSGSSMWMTEGIVVEVGDIIISRWDREIKKPALKVERNDKKVVTIKVLDRVTVLPTLDESDWNDDTIEEEADVPTLERITDLTELLTTKERQELVKNLIRESINLNLSDYSDSTKENVNNDEV